MVEKRDDVVKEFSDYLILVGLNNYRWQTLPKLRVRMQQFVGQDRVSCFNSFLHEFREGSSPFAQGHILCYLEEVSLYSARKVKYKLDGTLFRDTVDHFLQEARLIVCQIDFWETFDADRGNPLTYARTTLVSRLEERFTKHHSDYGLLLLTSNKYLEEDLKTIGYWGNQLSQYLAVVIELKKIGSDLPRVRRVIQEPTPVQLAEIAEAHQKLSGESLTSQKVRSILSQSITAIKSRQIKLSDPSIGIHDPWEWQINPPERGSEYAAYDHQALDSPEYTQILAPILKELIADLDSDVLLILNYGFVKINQELIGTIFSISQYTVSRYIDRTRDDLQKQLCRELLDRFASHPHLNIHLLDKQCMKKLLLPWYYRQTFIPEQLGEWLRSYPEALSNLVLLSVYFSILSQEDTDRLKYETTEASLHNLIKTTQRKLHRNLPEAAQKLRITEQELLARVQSLSLAGVNYLSSWLGDRYGLKANFLREINSNLEQSVYVFFATAPYAVLSQNLPEPPITKIFKNILSQEKGIFSAQWVTGDDLNLVIPGIDLGRQSRFYWARKVDLILQVANHSLGLLIGFKQESDKQYFVNIKACSTSKEDHLPENLQLLLLDNQGNIMKQVKSKISDNWIQVELRGSPQEEFQVKVQLEEISITENFVI